MMFEGVLIRVKKNLAQASLMASWHEQLRESIYSNTGAVAPLQLDDGSLAVLRNAAPEKLTWRLFDHYASVGQIYAIFELAIIELVEEYVEILPKVTPTYGALSASVKASHRVGVGHVLMKWSETQPIYGKIPESTIASGLADGLRGQNYNLLGAAFLTDSDNYRPDTLNRVFKKIGFDNAFSTIRNDVEIDEFCKQYLGDHNAESFLNKFVSDRNEAAHGEVGEILNLDQIKKYAQFVELIIYTFSRLLQSSLIKSGVASGVSHQVGVVIHVFSNGVCGVRACIKDRTIAVGQRLFVGKKSLMVECVKSLRQQKAVLQELQLNDGLEFGMGLDSDAKVGDLLYFTDLP